MNSDFSTIPLWGRKWDLAIRLADGSTQTLSKSVNDPQALRVTFDVLQSTLPSPYWFADIVVYNLNDATLQNLLQNAVWVTLQAGYQSGPSVASIIWDGPVMQVIFDRENVVDLTIRFNCIAVPANQATEFINRTFGAQQSQFNAFDAFIAQTGGDASRQSSDKAKQMLGDKAYPRGKTTFGKTSKYIAELADDNFLSTWTQSNATYLTELYNPKISLDPNLVYGPPLPVGSTSTSAETNITRSIIGVPKQGIFGAIFTVLLDPRLKVQLPPLLVKLDQTVIQNLKIQYLQVLTPLDQSGLFIAAQVRHYGDTRGNDWCTEVTGYTRGYSQGLLNGVFSAAQ